MASSGGEDFEDYLSEINDIQQGKTDSGTGQSDDELSKTPDEGEQEMTWLKEAGYGHLASKHAEGAEIQDEDINKETSSLTRNQAAAVKKRIDTLNATIRKTHKQQHRGDVRDVFGEGSEVSRHSEPGMLYTTDIPSSPSSGKARRRASAKTRDMSLLKSRGGMYSVQGAGLDNEVSGVATIGFKKEQNGDEQNVSQALKQKSRDAPYSVKEDENGVTRMNDLGVKDKVRIRALALMELTSLFDINDITYTRRKRKKKVKDHGWFGVPLQTLLDRDRKRNPHIKVPTVFLQLIQFLEHTGLQEEGILRVPGSATRIKELRDELEDGLENGKFSWGDVRANDAAGMLKQFIRELPVPLLTLEYIEAFAQVERIPKKEQKAHALNLLALLLPDVHLATLLMLLSFLKKVVDCEKNRMNLNNVAMIMAPNLFLVASSGRSKAPMSALDFHMAAGTASIAKMLIESQHVLNTVPPSMITQIRDQYESEQLKKGRDKSIMKFLHKKDKSDAYKKPTILCESDFNNQIVRVHVPGRKEPIPVQLKPKLSAGELLRGCYNHTDQTGNSHDGKKMVHLFEVGGNIGERRLDPKASMTALHRANPNAEWVIK